METTQSKLDEAQATWNGAANSLIAAKRDSIDYFRCRTAELQAYTALVNARKEAGQDRFGNPIGERVSS